MTGGNMQVCAAVERSLIVIVINITVLLLSLLLSYSPTMKLCWWVWVSFTIVGPLV